MFAEISNETPSEIVRRSKRSAVTPEKEGPKKQRILDTGNGVNADHNKTFVPPYLLCPYVSAGPVNRIALIVQLPGGNGTWDLFVNEGGHSIVITTSIDNTFYHRTNLLKKGLGVFFEDSVVTAFDVLLKDMRQNSTSKITYHCTINMPFQIQEVPKEVTPVLSDDHHYMLVALFEEPVNNYKVANSKKDFVKL